MWPVYGSKPPSCGTGLQSASRCKDLGCLVSFSLSPDHRVVLFPLIGHCSFLLLVTVFLQRYIKSNVWATNKRIFFLETKKDLKGLWRNHPNSFTFALKQMNQTTKPDIFSCDTLRLESSGWHHHILLRPLAFSLQALGDARKQGGKHGRCLQGVKILGKNKGPPPTHLLALSPSSSPWPNLLHRNEVSKQWWGKFCYSSRRKRY